MPRGRKPLNPELHNLKKQSFTAKAGALAALSLKGPHAPTLAKKYLLAAKEFDAHITAELKKKSVPEPVLKEKSTQTSHTPKKIRSEYDITADLREVRLKYLQARAEDDHDALKFLTPQMNHLIAELKNHKNSSRT